MQSRYEGHAELESALLRFLEKKHYKVTSKGSAGESLHEVMIDGHEKSQLWLCVSPVSIAPDSERTFFDIHWIPRTLDSNPTWMIGAALDIENYLTQHGASCVFGGIIDHPTGQIEQR